MKWVDGVLVLAALCIAWVIATIGYEYGKTAGRQAVEAVACEPTVTGVKRNGKEIPLTSAQRDSLSNDLLARVR